MPTYPSVTYSFSNGNASDATAVNQNFSDIINGLSDGTKDINVKAITAAGLVTASLGVSVPTGQTVATPKITNVAGTDAPLGGVPAGVICAFAGSSAPSGWNLCDRTELAQATYPALYTAIGTTWNTSTDPLTGSAQAAPSAGNFRVPNLKGVFLRGVADYSGADAYINDNDVVLGAYKVDQTQAHQHYVIDGGQGAADGGTLSAGGGSYRIPWANNSGDDLRTSAQLDDTTHGAPRTGYETNPKQIGANYIIKL